MKASTLFASAALALSPAAIVPGATWTAGNTGRHIQAHGAGITKVNGTYYMIGEDRTYGPNFWAINCYSTQDLVEWTFEGKLLSLRSSGDLGPNRVVERPKVIYNDITNKFVMYLHIDDASYGEAKIGLAVSDTVCGNYTYQGSWQPLGHQSRDIGLYQDTDGKGYLLSEERDVGLRLYNLTDDYLNVSSTVHLFSREAESPALVKRHNTYFLFGSGLTGFYPNDNVYSTASSLSGPWSEWKTFATPKTRTYASQTSFILPVGDTTIWMGDRWEVYDLKRSTYVWLPLDIQDTNVTMPFLSSWDLDSKRGRWLTTQNETSYEAEDADLERFRVSSCFLCSGGKAVSDLGTNGSVTFHVQSDRAAMAATQVFYVNGNCGERPIVVKANNGPGQVVSCLPTGSTYTAGTTIVHVELRQGNNSISIHGIGDGQRVVDLDRITVAL